MRTMRELARHLIVNRKIPQAALGTVAAVLLVGSVATAQTSSTSAPCDTSELCSTMYSVIAIRKAMEVQKLLPGLSKATWKASPSWSEADIKARTNDYLNAQIADHISQRFGYGLSSAERTRTLRGVTDTVLKGWLFELARVVESPPTTMTNPELDRLGDAFEITTTNSGTRFNPVKESVVDIYAKYKAENDKLELGTLCNDGKDNDLDRLKDSEDPSCNGTSNLDAEATGAERYRIHKNQVEILYWSGRIAGRFRALISAFGSERTINGNWSDAQSNFASVLEETFFNHFNVDYAKRRIDMGIGAGGYESTIHSKMFGTFFDLLKGVIWHPAMLHYLDNYGNTFVIDTTVNPPKPRASNQNLGRELLELHTLGLGSDRGWRGADGSPRGVLYTQTDVENSALLLTGLNVGSWTSFGSKINYLAHVPAQVPPVVLGQKFCLTPLENPAVIGASDTCATANAQDLRDATKMTSAITKQLDNYLRFLANHERTKINVCTKLVGRFVAPNSVSTGVDDDPDSSIDESVTEVQRSAVVKRCIEAWGQDGDLRALYRALLTSPETWAATNYNRFTKNPSDLVISAVRASGVTSNTFQTSSDTQSLGERLVAEMSYLGLPYRTWSAPTGYSELYGWMSQGYLVRWVTSSFRLANFLESRSTAANPAKQQVQREMYAPIMGIATNGTLVGSAEASCRGQSNELKWSVGTKRSAGMKRYEFLRELLGYGDVRVEASLIKTRTEAMLSKDPSYIPDENTIWGANKKMVWQKIDGKNGPSCVKSGLTSILASRSFLAR